MVFLVVAAFLLVVFWTAEITTVRTSLGVGNLSIFGGVPVTVVDRRDVAVAGFEMADQVNHA